LENGNTQLIGIRGKNLTHNGLKSVVAGKSEEKIRKKQEGEKDFQKTQKSWSPSKKCASSFRKRRALNRRARVPSGEGQHLSGK